MKRKILVTMLAGAMILGLVACGTKETEKPADDTKVESTTNDATDEEVVEEIVFTDETYDEMVETHGVKIKAELIEEVESTADDPLAECFVDVDGNETYLRKEYKYTDNDGNEYERVSGYKSEKYPDEFFDVTIKNADGEILVLAIMNGEDAETGIMECVFFNEDTYVAHSHYQYEKFLAENPDYVEAAPSEDVAE